MVLRTSLIYVPHDVCSVCLSVGWKEEALSEPANWRQTFEPVLILRKPHQTLLDHQNSIININGNINNFKVRADDEL